CIDVDLGHPAKKIMNIAEYALVRTSEENAQVIGFTFIKPVQFDRILGSRRRDKFIDFSVRITCQVDERCQPRRLLIQPLQRHNRKNLTDGPIVLYGLEDGKVT